MLASAAIEWTGASSESVTGLTPEHRVYAAEPERIRVELVDPVAGLPQPPDDSLSTTAANAPDVTEANGCQTRTSRRNAGKGKGTLVSILSAFCRHSVSGEVSVRDGLS